MYEEIRSRMEQAVSELLAAAKLKRGDLLVIGCSSSEVMGQRIGTGSSMEAAKAVYTGCAPVLSREGIALAVQCCEHLNRALIVEQATAERYGYEMVNVRPQSKAGGSLATVAWTSAEPSLECICKRLPYRCGYRCRESERPFCCAPGPDPNSLEASGLNIALTSDESGIEWG